ncbi:TPA: hypothetical protein U8251_003960 [Pseudomonas putida]|nr:hypothetical protein [Pseudomonas putida]
MSDLVTLLQPQAFDPATSTMLVSVAATDYALQAIVVPFLTALRKQAPYIRLAIRAVDLSSPPTQLEQIEVDITLVTPEMTAPGASSTNLFDERCVCLMRTGQPDARFSFFRSIASASSSMRWFRCQAVHSAE